MGGNRHGVKCNIDMQCDLHGREEDTIPGSPLAESLPRRGFRPCRKPGAGTESPPAGQRRIPLRMKWIPHSTGGGRKTVSRIREGMQDGSRSVTMPQLVLSEVMFVTGERDGRRVSEIVTGVTGFEQQE